MTATETTIDTAARSSGVLDTLPSRQRTTGEQAAARSRLVKRLRIILPMAAVLLVFLFFRNMQSDQADTTWLEDFKLDVAPEELEMADLQFTGVDSEGAPYVITAENVTRTGNDEEGVVLRNPRALTNSNNESSVVSAADGVYRANDKMLDLERDVTFEHLLGEDKYTLRTTEARVSIEDKRVETDAGVVGDGPDGSTIVADGMRAYQDENRVVFVGNVRL
ncbi:MAG: LPS export ABC transporter periplasmic protein LptC, partial [Pseudomonadota bacterium]